MQYGCSWTDLTLNSWYPPGPGHLLQQREGESAVARNRAEGEEQQAPWLWKMYENATYGKQSGKSHQITTLNRWHDYEKCQPSTGCPSDGEIGKSIDNTFRHRLAIKHGLLENRALTNVFFFPIKPLSTLGVFQPCLMPVSPVSSSLKP